MSEKELLLGKYVLNPVRLHLTASGLMSCQNVIIDDSVLDFDAVTDPAGDVHGVLVKSDGHIVYFKLTDAEPVTKTIASGISESSLRHFSVTEESGALHIFIVRAEKSLTLYHYRTENGVWVRSQPRMLDLAFEYVGSCPCPKGCFAVLVKSGIQDTLLFESGGRWQALKHASLPDVYDDLSLTYCNGTIEAVTRSPSGIISTALATADTFRADEKATRKEHSAEDTMANGNVINSKFIQQLNENTDELSLLKEEVAKLKEALTALQHANDSSDKQYKFLVSCKDSLRQHDNQLNQLSLKTQELANRINAIRRE